MNGVLTAALLCAAGLLGLPILVFWIECMAALVATRSPAPTGRRGRLAVVIPAHDEELGIAPTLRAILPGLSGGDRLLVIADNCTDGTAAAARAAGAEVFERNDAERRGKGHALAYGLERLKSDPPELVVFIDADTIMSPEALDLLARKATDPPRPAQGAYLLEAPPGSGLRTLLSSFAVTVKNLVRPRGLAVFGVPCLLTGSGMAIPWGMIDVSGLATGNIVEDMQLGISLALRGTPPLFCPDARVTGSLPSGGKAAWVQRTRWEHGHLLTLLTQCPRLAWGALRRGRPGLLAMALDLAIPPLAFLCLLWAILAGGAALAALRGFGRIPALVAGIEGALLGSAVLAAWLRYARRSIPFWVLLAVPFYVLWKLPLYVLFLLRRQKSWVRTPRQENSGRGDAPR